MVPFTLDRQLVVERKSSHRDRISKLAAKSGGSLLKHLQAKMKDISNRGPKSTISLVEHQEQLMLARIRFQDAVAELTLQDRMENTNP